MLEYISVSVCYSVVMFYVYVWVCVCICVCRWPWKEPMSSSAIRPALSIQWAASWRYIALAPSGIASVEFRAKSGIAPSGLSAPWLLAPQFECWWR